MSRNIPGCDGTELPGIISDVNEIMAQAQRLTKMHVKDDKWMSNVWLSPHDTEVRMVEVSDSAPHCGEIYPWAYRADPEIGYHFVTVLILCSTKEWEMVQSGQLSLPEGWDRNKFINLYDGEDPRKTGLKNGLRQLNVRQLKRVMEYQGEMVLDEHNYQDGKFCPLAVALGLDKTMENPSHDRVFQTLTDLGYDVYNTRGIVGKFYTDHRKEDLLEAAQEVLEEKLEQ